jgi:hypothetical protein
LKKKKISELFINYKKNQFVHVILMIFFHSLIHFIVFSHDLQTRVGVNQSRSGTQRLFGEHKSQTPSPHFRLEDQ